MIGFLLVFFVVLVILRMPIAFALGIACILAITLFGGTLLTAVPHKMVNGIDNYTFLAIPLFLLAGNLMNAGGLTERMFKFGRAPLGQIHGGLAHACVAASALFAWMTGSAVATVGGLGKVEVKALTENGYDRSFAAAVPAASSILGPIIPPSIPMIIYAAMTEESIGRLFLGGILPGLLMAFSVMLLIYILARLKNFPKDDSASWSERCLRFKKSVIPLLMPLIMLGGINSGIFTPTEAAAVGALYALIVSLFVYRTVRFSDLPGIFAESMVTTAVITLIISNTNILSFLLTLEQSGARLADSMLAFTSNPLVVLVLVNIVLLILGALMEAGVVLILLILILYPLMVVQYGIDPIHFGVLMCTNLMIGCITPPIGVSLFVMTHVSGLKMEKMIRAILPFFNSAVCYFNAHNLCAEYCFYPIW